MKKIMLLSITLCFFTVANLQAQFVDGTKGLLCMPSAEFEEDATFMISNNYLDKHFLPNAGFYGWNDKGSFGYAFSVTLWSRLEIAYSCTLINTEKMRPGVYTHNQDRHFAARVAITKDGMPTGPQAAITWNPVWLNGISFMLWLKSSRWWVFALLACNACKSNRNALQRCSICNGWAWLLRCSRGMKWCRGGVRKFLTSSVRLG